MGTAREIISLNFGQAGIQIGDAMWQTITAEHNISSVGEMPYEAVDGWEVNALTTFFHNGPNNRYIPRALVVDTEPTVVGIFIPPFSVPSPLLPYWNIVNHAQPFTEQRFIILA